MKKILVTGSHGLIGSEASVFFAKKGFKVYGLDNNMRKSFFGQDGDTSWMKREIEKKVKDYKHIEIDIRNKEEIFDLFKNTKFDLIIHTAAQPAHDFPAKIDGGAHIDFGVNAVGTLNLLEATRQYCKDAPFIFTSTNKVYGDSPNFLPLIEKETRWEIDENHEYYNGIDESMSIDQCKHSLFGASKVAADILVQEYGKYFDMLTVSFRGGCLCGLEHSAVELHGFLNYLVRCVKYDKEYRIFSHKGKQVRDNIHNSDVVEAFYQFYLNPKCGEVYNLGGGRFSNCSMMEAFQIVENLTGKKSKTTYIEESRIGDHIWYISSMEKFKKDYPNWEQKYTIEMILKEISENV